MYVQQAIVFLDMTENIFLKTTVYNILSTYITADFTIQLRIRRQFKYMSMYLYLFVS